MTKPLRETAKLTSVADPSVVDASSGHMSIQVLSPGWGSSGYYSQAVVESAAPLIEVGTHMFLDHPTATDAQDRPERSVRDLAAVVTEAGRWDPDVGAVVAKCTVARPFREVIEDLAPHIGLSIRGSATDIVEGEAEGQMGPIVEGLADISSVDFVTRAGRGGKVLELLESARAGGAKAKGMETTVKVEVDASALEAALARAAEAGSALGADLDRASFGDRINDLVARNRKLLDEIDKRNVPVTRPGNTTAEASKEDTNMTTKQIEESEHTRLVEQAGRVPALEKERDEHKDRADKAEAREAERTRVDEAHRIVAEQAKAAKVTFEPLEERGLMAQLPVDGDGKFDAAKFTEAVKAEADAKAKRVAEAAQAAGAGQVTGNGLRVVEAGDGNTGAPRAIAEADPTQLDQAVFGPIAKEA